MAESKCGRPRFPLLAAVFLLAGCEGGPPASVFQLRDSAGIQIAESSSPAWTEGAGWRLGESARLRIGVLDGEETLQFNGIAGAARLPDGTIVVGDGGSGEVRYFDASGQVVAVAGGAGEGPGEFVGMAGLGSDPDGRVWAYDFSLRRVSWFDGAGDVLGITSLGPAPPTLNGIGPLPDGTFLLKQLWGAGVVAESTELGLRRDPVAFVRFSREGELVDTVGLFPGREMVISEEGGRGVMSTPPFAKNTSSTVWGNALVVGTQEEFELVQYSAEGEAIRIVRIPGWDLSLTRADVERYIQGRVSQAPEAQRPALREELEGMPVPSTMPAYGGLLADGVGNLWVAEWVIYPDMPERWTVLDPDGAWLGTVEVPGRFTPFAIGDDWVLGVELDELDVEYVALYPLEKG